jgi:hypothetical protein
LEKQKREQKRTGGRNESQMKREQRGRNDVRVPIRPRNQQQQKNNTTRNRGRNEQRIPTAEESYYEEIPINHPHRTLNFFSQTMNEQFEMMK